MLCHLHPAASAHASCERCQRGLCRVCTQQFKQRLCTHCVDAHAQARLRSARRTLWLSVPVFALASWSSSLALRELPVRARLFCALLAGVLAFGAWLGLRRWRRSQVEGTPSFADRVSALAAGLVFWPWLLLETVRDVRLAGRLRASLPPEARGRSFGLGELCLAVGSVAATFTLGLHGLQSFTPVSPLHAVEARITNSAETVVPSHVSGEPVAPAALPQPKGDSALARPGARSDQPPSSARLERAQEASAAQTPAQEARRHRRRSRAHEAAPAPEAEAEWPWDEPVARHSAPAAGLASVPIVAQTSAPAFTQPDPIRQPILAAPAGFPARAMRQRRFGAGSLPRQPTFGGSGAPASSFAPSSGRSVIAAPPPVFR